MSVDEDLKSDLKMVSSFSGPLGNTSLTKIALHILTALAGESDSEPVCTQADLAKAIESLRRAPDAGLEQRILKLEQSVDELKKAFSS